MHHASQSPQSDSISDSASSPQLTSAGASPIESRPPTPLLKETETPFLAIGEKHNLLLHRGKLFAWGDNTYGQLGLGQTSHVIHPTQIKAHELSAFAQWKKVAAGPNHSLAVDDGNQVWGWGDNNEGQLGIPQVIRLWEPTPLVINAAIIEVAAGDTHSLALDTEGHLWIWGTSHVGALGLGGRTFSPEPTRINMLGANRQAIRWKKIAAGAYHNLAIDSDNQLWVWGSHACGQLGLGNLQRNIVPRPTLLKINGIPLKCTHIAPGRTHSLAISLEKQLVGWGANDKGQLGIRRRNTINIPRRIILDDSPVQVTVITAGLPHSCAIDSEGALWVWGDMPKGQRGKEERQAHPKPARVPFPLNRKCIAIVTGENRSLGIDSLGQWFALGEASSPAAPAQPISASIFSMTEGIFSLDVSAAARYPLPPPPNASYASSTEGISFLGMSAAARYPLPPPPNASYASSIEDIAFLGMSAAARYPLPPPPKTSYAPAVETASAASVPPFIDKSATAPLPFGASLLFCDIACNTNDTFFSVQSIALKINLLRTALQELAQEMRTRAIASGAPVSKSIQGILTAPEFFFSQGIQAGRCAQYSEKEMHETMGELASLSRDFPTILIIPGTIVWQKDHFNPALHPFEKSEDLQTDYERYLGSKYQRGVEVIKTFEEWSQKQKQPRTFDKIRDTLSQTENQFGITHPAYTEIPQNSYVNKWLLLSSSQTPLFITRNTAFFYLNGKLRYKYHKSFDAQELMHQPWHPTLFLQGTSPPLCNIAGINLGIEICMDHAAKHLSKYLTAYNVPPPDIHLILSGCTQSRFEHMRTQGGGYVIHSSTAEKGKDKAGNFHPYRGAWQYNQSRLMPLEFKKGPDNSLNIPFNFVSLTLEKRYHTLNDLCENYQHGELKISEPFFYQGPECPPHYYCLTINCTLPTLPPLMMDKETLYFSLLSPEQSLVFPPIAPPQQNFSTKAAAPLS
jgi:predicted amidohydrolase